MCQMCIIALLYCMLALLSVSAATGTPHANGQRRRQALLSPSPPLLLPPYRDGDGDGKMMLGAPQRNGVLEDAIAVAADGAIEDIDDIDDVYDEADVQRVATEQYEVPDYDAAADALALPLVYASDDDAILDPIAVAVPLSLVTAMVDDGDERTELPVSNYREFYDDLLIDAKRQDAKRSAASAYGSGDGLLMPSIIGCDCKIRNELLDLGADYFPRYLLNAVCQSEWDAPLPGAKCRGGSRCQALEYKLKVLTMRYGRRMSGRGALALSNADAAATATAKSQPRRALRKQWRFKTITVAAGCFCSY